MNKDNKYGIIEVTRGTGYHPSTGNSTHFKYEDLLRKKYKSKEALKDAFNSGSFNTKSSSSIYKHPSIPDTYTSYIRTYYPVEFIYNGEERIYKRIII